MLRFYFNNNITLRRTTIYFEGQYILCKILRTVFDNVHELSDVIFSTLCIFQNISYWFVEYTHWDAIECISYKFIAVFLISKF